MPVSSSIQERQERLRSIRAARLASKSVETDKSTIAGEAEIHAAAEAGPEKNPVSKSSRQQRKKRAAARNLQDEKSSQKEFQQEESPNVADVASVCIASSNASSPCVAVTTAETMECNHEIHVGEHRSMAKTHAATDSVVEKQDSVAAPEAIDEDREDPKTVATNIDADGPCVATKVVADAETVASPCAQKPDQCSKDLLMKQLLASQASSTRPRNVPKNKTQERLQKQVRLREETKIREMLDAASQASGETSKPRVKKTRSAKKVQKQEEPVTVGQQQTSQSGVHGGA